ncbi:MAG: hypothetical protein RR063_07455 [Anaerovoracaceae bacterium]
MIKKNVKRLIAMVLIAVMVTASPVLAAGLEPKHTYTNGQFTFEKVSHPNSGVETNDGIVDYMGESKIAPYVEGVTPGNGDRGQSYSYASAVYGDWVYINTMYGGLGAANIIIGGMGDIDPEVAKATIDALYNGNMYMGEPDGAYTGGVLLKFNVKTGETKILMSRDSNGLIPTFRNACMMNGKMYFVGMIIDLKADLTPEELKTAIATQNGFPCVYEIDPENGDAMKKVYDCVDIDGYRKLVADKVFTSTRAIGTFKDSIIAGALDTDGVFLTASNNPGAGQESFEVIADMNDLFNYPAYHRSDVNSGGGIYQVIEYNGDLYVAICTGKPESRNEHGTLQAYAIVKGECSGDPTNRADWTWTPLVGDQAKDGARYPFGLSSERLSAGACTLEVYDGYLYIGEYNDVSSALQGFVLKHNLRTLATNLEQSVNMYRMDKNENISLVVGDDIDLNGDGQKEKSLSGLGSGYTTHMSQYTWQTMVYEGKLYVSTMDTTTLLEPIAQFTNGDILEMSEEEWQRLINYIRVLLQLLFESKPEEPAVLEGANSLSTTPEAAILEGENSLSTTPEPATKELTEEEALALVNKAIKEASELAADTKVSVDVKATQNAAQNAAPIALNQEQVQELVAGLMNGSIAGGMVAEEQMTELTKMNAILDKLTALVETTDIEKFTEEYSKLLEEYNSISELLPENLKEFYEMVLQFNTEDNLKALRTSLGYMKDSKAGFDLYEITNNNAGSVSVNAITTDGFGDRFNHGLRIFAKTKDYLLVGTANPFYGTQLWRRKNTVPAPTPVPDNNNTDVGETTVQSKKAPYTGTPAQSSGILFVTFAVLVSLGIVVKNKK